jgi:putative transposase
VIDYLTDWAEKTELPLRQLSLWAGLRPSKLYDWRRRYGKANEHNSLVPRDHWLEDSERDAIVDYHDKNPLEGYRRLTFMMLDDDVVAASPSTVYRVLKAAGRLDRWNPKPSKKGTGFNQPLEPHEHWHIDIAYINVATASAASSFTGSFASR